MEKAIKQLNQELEIEDALRLDHDTKGVEGSPDIASTILEKVDECDIFIGDISFIAKSKSNKYCPNPNVLIELGYALNCLSDARVINVMNSVLNKNTPILGVFNEVRTYMFAVMKLSGLIPSLEDSLIRYRIKKSCSTIFMTAWRLMLNFEATISKSLSISILKSIFVLKNCAFFVLTL